MRTSRSEPAIVVVLGGSSAFLPSLADALADLAGDLPALEVRLFGREPARTASVARFCSMHCAGRGVAHRYVAAADLETALDDAAVVVNQVRIGGFAGRSSDERFALGFGYPGDETIGPSGLSAAVRSTGPVLELARAVERAAPEAWFVQISNPMAMLLASLLETTHLRTFGLCELPDHTLAEALELVRCSGSVRSDYVGINHQGWFVRIESEGEDLLPRIFAAVEDLAGNFTDKVSGNGFFRVDPSVMRARRALPLPYLRLLEHREREVAAMRARPADRGAQLQALSETLFAHYASARDGTMPPKLGDRAMPWNAMTVAPVIGALVGGPGAVAYVSERNDGHLGFLPDEAIVEKRATITSRGVRATPVASPVERTHPEIAATLRRIAAFDRLGATAARSQDPAAAREALRVHPFAIPDAVVAKMVDRMFPPFERRERSATG